MAGSSVRLCFVAAFFFHHCLTVVCRKIDRLPGAHEDSDLAQHTGYLEAVPGQRTFYWLVEAETAPGSAPLLIWMNGGPGASSLNGLFGEMGPELLNGQSVPGGTRQWRLFRNPYSWHRIANVLAWEQPAGVGFSYCVNSTSCPLPWNDTSSAAANVQILLEFLRVWPQFQGRDLFITGIAVGDGCIGYGVPGACGPDTMWALVNFMEGSGAIEVDEAALIRRSCGDELKHGGLGPGTAGFSRTCRQALKGFASALGDYNSYRFASPCGPSELGNWGSGEAYACGVTNAIQKYFNDQSVQKAIGTFGLGPKNWTNWDGDGPNYNITVADTLPAYRSLLNAGVRILIYNGLQDSVVNHVDAVEWVQRLGGPIVSRRTWSSGDSHAAGRVTAFRSALRYVTIRGAGHLVPADRPREAFAMMSAWVRGNELPEYDGGCQRIWLGRGWGDFCKDSAQQEANVIVM